MNVRNGKITLGIMIMLILLLAACVPAAPMPAAENSADDMTSVESSAEAMMRETGASITVQDLGDIVVHSYLAPEQVFANNTHIIETANSLVLIDTQFLLPNAMDFRAYADSLGKPIERLVITHEHPDHFLGGEAFADVDMYALAEVVTKIEENGQAEIDEKQADFGDAIASTYVVPTAFEAGTVEIDGVSFEFEAVMNAEAEMQLVIKMPAHGVVAVGDIVYSGTHLILAGNPPTWIEALENLKAESGDYPVVLPGHGVSTDPSVYDTNIAWLAKAGELMGTATSGEEFKAGLVDAFPELGMVAAIDFVLPFLFPEDGSAMESDQGGTALGLIEVITVALADGATIDEFLPANEAIDENYASQQPGYLSRETAVSADGQVRLAVYWESKADSDNSIAGFGEAPGLEEFMAYLNPETMAIKQYELRSSTSDQVTFPSAGVTEVITVKLQEGADADSFVAANQALEESYIVQQPGFIAREVGVAEDGEWLIAIHWETAEDSAASIAKFEEAPGVETFMSFLDVETMAITVFDIHQ